MKTIVPFIVGPTAVGKTALSILIGKKLNVEIVSADSRQIYKYLDIGTAKVEPDIQEKIPHHFIDICEPDEYYSAGKFASAARIVIENISANKKVPLVVGGSGFYIQALIDGIFELDVRDKQIRSKLEDKLASEGLSELYSDLEKNDPVYASKISANDPQRILRALEVFYASGKAFSEWHLQKTKPADFEPLIYGLTMDREELNTLINKRVDVMIERGLLSEVKKMQEKGYSRDINALNTVGYKEVFDYFDGLIDKDEMVELIKRNSRRYAKRQMTWFRRDKRVIWREIARLEDLEKCAKEMLNRVNP